MKWKKLKKAEERAKDISNTLVAGDFSGKKVNIVHDDGSKFNFKYAFLKKITIDNEEFICVFTEHHGVWVWYGEEIKEYNEVG